ncbi:hypothetical protein [Streptomyces sp. NPDC048720]|uniref:hypothetical protein n=1 Tax=Streptomyces sp. NPDC048720 TaxID=3365588 RepID=UPI00371944A4
MVDQTLVSDDAWVSFGLCHGDGRRDFDVIVGEPGLFGEGAQLGQAHCHYFDAPLTC